MKTKTLFLSLLSGAFICFSSASYAQYHGGGSGDGAFGQGSNDINVGVGFLGSGAATIATANGTNSVGPAYELSYERGLTSNIGLGIFISDQSATSTYSSSYSDYVFNYNTFTYTPVTYTTTDNYKVSLINIDIRGAYHFTVNSKFDPYLGIALGYCDASASDNQTSNEPGFVNTGGASVSITGVEYGLFGGARYWFSDHIGAWLELQYTHATFTYDGYSSSINTSNVINLGISFKF